MLDESGIRHFFKWRSVQNGNEITTKKYKWELSVTDENGEKISFLNLDSRCQREIIRLLKANYEKGEVEG